MAKAKKSGWIRPWKVRKSERVLDNRWAKVRRDVCVLPGGKVIPDYYYWEGGDFAQVFAVTVSGEVVLTRQYKHGAQEIVLELPAGLIGPKGEKPLTAAKRELREETGFVAEDWVSLGRLNVSSAKSTARAHVFLATQAKRNFDTDLDDTEAIEVVLVSMKKLLGLISRNKIRDSGSIATTLLALKKLKKNPS